MTEEVRIKLSVIYEAAVKIGFPFLIGVAGWTFTAITDHEKRLNHIEATRYTQEDAKAADRDRSRLEREIAVAKANASETVKRLDRFEAKLDAVLKELRK